MSRPRNPPMRVSDRFDAGVCARCDALRLEKSNFCAACKLSRKQVLSDWLAAEDYGAKREDKGQVRH